MAYEYVKRTYGVPVEVGQRVTFKGEGKQGTVVSRRTYDQYVYVRFDGVKFAVRVHPDDLEYGDKPSAEVK